MPGLLGSWAWLGILKHQQPGQAKQQMFLLLLVLVDLCIDVSASAIVCFSTSSHSDPASTSFSGGASAWPVFKTAFLVPSNSTRSAHKTSVPCVPLQFQRVSHRQMDSQAAARHALPEGLVKGDRTPWINPEPCSHRECYSLLTKPVMFMRRFPAEGEVYGGPLTLVMRAHIHRSHSRLGRPQSHRKALLRNLATQASLSHNITASVWLISCV